jgi:hypothetical protein
MQAAQHGVTKLNIGTEIRQPYQRDGGNGRRREGPARWEVASDLIVTRLAAEALPRFSLARLRDRPLVESAC